MNITITNAAERTDGGCIARHNPCSELPEMVVVRKSGHFDTNPSLARGCEDSQP